MNEDGRTAQQILAEFAADQELPLEPGSRGGEFVLTLPGEKKLRTVCSVVFGERDLSLSAFVIRHPDENHEGFFRYLLRHNLRTPGLAYAVDRNDDVYVVGRLPLEACTPHALDQLLGVVLEAADSAFNELLLLGFVTSMRREWAWRVARGESLRNLEAFREVLAGSEHDPAYAVPAAPEFDAQVPAGDSGRAVVGSAPD